MNTVKFFALAALGIATVAASADEERETFGKWRIGVGAAFNAGVKANLSSRNLPMPMMYQVLAGSTKADAMNRALSHRYDGGGYISPDSLDNGFSTENWRLPVPAYQGSGHFVLDNAYQEVVASSGYGSYRNTSDDEWQYGLSVELSRELWIHDEEEEHRWGVDFAAAFSYFFRRDIYSANGTVTRIDQVRDGAIRTDVNDSAAMWKYDNGYDSPSGGMYGHGNYTWSGFAPALGWSSIGTPYDVGGPTHPVAGSYNYNASGDYRELEMLFMLRPWYEITDWWRVFGEIGVGVSWGRFESSVSYLGGGSSENFDQWDCYGVAGLGTAFRYGDFDISIDFMGRFLRDDLEVRGRNVNGSIERPVWGFRVMLGYSF